MCFYAPFFKKNFTGTQISMSQPCLGSYLAIIILCFLDVVHLVFSTSALRFFTYVFRFFFFIVHQAFTSQMLLIFTFFTFSFGLYMFSSSIWKTTHLKALQFFFVCWFLDYLVQHLSASSRVPSPKFIRLNLLRSLE